MQVDAVQDAGHGQLADARQGKDRLGQHGAGEEQTQLQPDHRDDRDQGVAQGMLPDHGAPWQPLGARRADMVGAQFLHHRGAGHAADAGHREEREGHGRQDQVLHAGPQRVHVAGEQAVEHGHARDAMQRDAVVEGPADRQPL